MKLCSRGEVNGHGAIQVCEVWENVVQSWELLRRAHERGQVTGSHGDWLLHALLQGESSRLRALR